MSDIDFNLLRRGLNKIKTSSSDAVARTTADLLLAYMDSMDGKLVETTSDDLQPIMIVGDYHHDGNKNEIFVTCPQTPANKIGMIKDLRSLFSWGLKESKDFVEGNYEAKIPVNMIQQLRQIAINHRVTISCTSHEKDEDVF